jgi:hypothetical protein
MIYHLNTYGYKIEKKETTMLSSKAVLSQYASPASLAHTGNNCRILLPPK